MPPRKLEKMLAKTPTTVGQAGQSTATAATIDLEDTTDAMPPALHYHHLPHHRPEDGTLPATATERENAAMNMSVAVRTAHHHHL